MVKYIIYLLKLFLFLLIYSNSYATCTYNGTVLNTSNGAGTPVNDSSEGVGEQCDDMPNFYSLDFYRMSLCSANVNPVGGAADFSSCTDMLNVDTPINAVINRTAETSLNAPDFTLQSGTYGYMVAIISSKMGIKHSFEVNTAVDTYDSGSALNGAGTYCWTKNNFLSTITNEAGVVTPHGTTVNGGISDISNFECSNTASDVSNAEFTYEAISVLDGDGSSCAGGLGANGDRVSMGLLGTGLTTGRLLQDDGETNATDCTNSAKILWVIELTNPVTITPTSQITMFFKTTDSVSIDFDSSAIVNPILLKAGANPPQAYISASE